MVKSQDRVKKGKEPSAKKIAKAGKKAAPARLDDRPTFQPLLRPKQVAAQKADKGESAAKAYEIKKQLKRHRG